MPRPEIPSLLLLLAPATAQLQLEPAQPRAGSTITVSFRDKQGLFRADEPVFAVASWLSDKDLRYACRALRNGRAQLDTPADAHYVYIYVTSRRRSARRQQVASMVFDAHGAPRRGARVRAMMDQQGKCEELLQAEQKAFPDSFAGYRMRWMLEGGPELDAAGRRMVETDLEHIGAAENPSALLARSAGLMLLGREPEARALVLQALQRHPHNIYTAQTYSNYSYQCYAQDLPRAQAIDAALREAITAHPDSRLARAEIRNLSGDTRLSIESVQAACAAWQRRAPGHPEADYVLARAIQAHDGDRARALLHAERAATSYLRGELRLLGDSYGTLSQMMLPAALRLAGELALELEAPLRALGHARTLQTLEQRQNPRSHALAARAYAALQQDRRAAQAWARARGLGHKQAAAALRALHRRLAPDQDLDTWSDALLRSRDAARPSRKTAPAFRLTDLEGCSIDLEQLRGKVVVLNFWGLGCAPCKVEIPHLNELLARFADQPVEFLALGTDPADRIGAYLKKRPFHYRQLPAAGPVAGRYGVRSWPTHVFIDKQGKIAATFVGGSKDVAERFSPVILRLLRE